MEKNMIMNQNGTELRRGLASSKNISIWGAVGALLAIIALVVTMYFQLEGYLFNSYRDLQDKFYEMSLSVDRLKESNRALNSIVVSPLSTAEKKSLSSPVHPEKTDVNPNKDKQTSK